MKEAPPEKKDDTEPAGQTVTVKVRSTRRGAATISVQDIEEEKEIKPFSAPDDPVAAVIDQNGVEPVKEPEVAKSSVVKIQLKSKPASAIGGGATQDQPPQRASSTAVGRRRTRQAAGGSVGADAEEKVLKEAAQDNTHSASVNAQSAGAGQSEDTAQARRATRNNPRKRQRVE